MAVNDEEAEWGSDPNYPDSDGDWVMDGDDTRGGREPVITERLVVTLKYGSGTDFNFFRELRKPTVDVAFLIDTTCSMGSTISAVATEFSTIVSRLESEIEGSIEVQYGFATYDDYAYGSMGSSSCGDRPFNLVHQVTSDSATVKSLIEATPMHCGADGPESTMEALYQGLTGAGYDQNCNGSYDSATAKKTIRLPAHYPPTL